MKTKHLLLTFLTVLCFQQVMRSQELNSKIKASVVEIGDSFTQIPQERLLILDQVAFKLFKQCKDKNVVDVIIVDKENQEISQLAMIWLTTGLFYYGNHSMFTIQSAGTSIQPSPLSQLNSLKQFGFKVKSGKPNSVTIKYGSGNWNLYPKTLESLKPNSETVEIVVQEGIEQNSNVLVLPFPDTDNIAREMLYLATRINNLSQIKQ